MPYYAYQLSIVEYRIAYFLKNKKRFSISISQLHHSKHMRIKYVMERKITTDYDLIAYVY